MNTLLLAIVAASALPTPHFSPGLPLPTPRFGPLPVAMVVVESVHTAKPTVKPRVFSHSYRTTPHQRGCEMCLGQHLRNYHGEKSKALDARGYPNWVRYHELLHDAAVYKPSKPAGSPACQGGSCSRPRTFGRFFSRWR